MRRWMHISLALAVFHLVPAAWGADARDTVARIARKARIEARSLRLMTAPLDEPPLPTTTFVLGLAHDEDELDTRTYSTPFGLSYQPADQQWEFAVWGDGYVRTTPSEGLTIDGLGDLGFDISRRLSRSSTGAADEPASSWTGTLGASVPTGGQIGSSSATQHLKLAYQAGKTPWTYFVWGDVKHYNGEHSGQSDFAQMIYGEIDYEVAKDHVVLVNLTRWHRRGADVPGTTDLGIEYDFPIIGKHNGALSFTRGITRGAQHSGVELDWIYSF